MTLYIQTADVMKMGMVPSLRVSAIGCNSNVEYFLNAEKLCVPGTSPVISELSNSYTKHFRLHDVHRSVPTPIACSIRSVYTIFHTVPGWEGL